MTENTTPEPQGDLFDQFFDWTEETGEAFTDPAAITRFVEIHGLNQATAERLAYYVEEALR